jgi:integrase
VRLGHDPSEERRTNKLDVIEHVVDQFVERDLKRKRRAESYINSTRGLFNNHVLTKWRGRDIKTINRYDAVQLLDTIADDGKPISANRVRAALGRLFNWCVERGIIEASPITRLPMPSAEARRERVLGVNEISILWPQFEVLGYPFGSLLQMILITGQRRTEVAHMRWVDVDEADRTWTLPSELTKAGRAHVVPLSFLAIDVLGEIRQSGLHTDSLYVFTTLGDRPISGYSLAKKRLDAAVTAVCGQAGLAPLDHWTIHDLRRTVGTGLGKLGISRFIIGRVLNHADRTVTGIYDRHEYLAEKRHALDAWARYLGNLTAEPAANVVALRS